MAAGLAGRVGAEPLGEERIATDRVRVFFGLPVPDEHRRALEPYLAACAAAAPLFRWAPAANLHVTVRFLGHVERSLAEGVATALEGDALRGFDLELGQLGFFKRGRLARVVWMGLTSGVAEATALAAQVEARCVQAGLEPERRAFNAHLTLARARHRDGAPAPELSGPPHLPAWRADELILYRSQMGRGGSVYEPARRIKLR